MGDFSSFALETNRVVTLLPRRYCITVNKKDPIFQNQRRKRITRFLKPEKKKEETKNLEK